MKKEKEKKENLKFMQRIENRDFSWWKEDKELVKKEIIYFENLIDKLQKSKNKEKDECIETAKEIIKEIKK